MWQLYQWENCHLLLPYCLWCCSESQYSTSRWLSSSLCPLFLFHPLWSGITEATRMLIQTPFYQLFTVSAADCVQNDKRKTFATVEKSPPLGPPPILKRPQEIMRFDAVISRLLRAVFQWCYLSCSVPTPCNDDLSLFSVMCSIFIYDQASFSLYFFGFITHFLCHTCN